MGLKRTSGGRVKKRPKRWKMVRVSKTQTGTSNRKIDRRIVARRAGVRISASGRRYTERRANRSDKRPRKKL